ncbi:hypothetical protein F0562_016865 [Nyssa sinensis]|uniref:Uncharacterized protein n=1 Tax=Nyssa sinensis TaxID=561372 RepID=A0A5J4ZDR4_9ASTE|nr:hypothetical protein F0562_016865 [Nyssa sinensis]
MKLMLLEHWNFILQCGHFSMSVEISLNNEANAARALELHIAVWSLFRVSVNRSCEALRGLACTTKGEVEAGQKSFSGGVSRSSTAGGGVAGSATAGGEKHGVEVENSFQNLRWRDQSEATTESVDSDDGTIVPETNEQEHYMDGLDNNYGEDVEADGFPEGRMERSTEDMTAN